MLTGPGVENDDEEACEDGQLQAEKDDMLLLVVHDAKLLMIGQAENREQAVEDARCVSMLLFFSQFFNDFIVQYYRISLLGFCFFFLNNLSFRLLFRNIF